MSVLLQVQSLSKTFGNLRVLDRVSFELRRGEVLGLVGRRGAGKSTLLHLIAGVNQPSGGKILLDGRALHLTMPSQAHRRGIELVHQAPQLVEQQDITQNIFLGRELRKPMRVWIPDRERMFAQARAFMTEFGLRPGLLFQRVGSLTVEQRHLVALARAFCQPPRLLLLDDMLSQLNFHRQQVLLQRIRELAGEGMGAIVCSEDLKYLFNLTDRLLVLYEGRLIADLRTADCTPREVVELIVGVDNREQITPVIWALESYHQAQRQTEDLFRRQAELHVTLEASDTLNRQLVEKLRDQVKAMNRLNKALQQTQRRLMTEREEERKSLARELHDSVIQDLLSLNYRLEETELNEISAEQRRELGEIRHAIRQVVGDLRQLCRDLRPPTIDNLGLSTAIRSFVQEWEDRTGIEINMEIDEGIGWLPESIELSVFRIIQEGLNNVSKHADAQIARLDLRRTPADNLLIRISDNGRGFEALPNLADLSAQKHYGLVGISERAALLGGSMRIESPGKGGLVLQVEIPSPYPSE